METETIIKLEPRQTIYPFENKKFSNVDLAEYYRKFNGLTPNFSEALLQTDVEFNGVIGHLRVNATAQTFNWERVITPMGPVEINVKNNNGQIDVVSIPLLLNLYWENINSPEQFKLINSYEPRAAFLREVLPLDYHQDRLGDLDQLVENWFKDGSPEIPLFSATDLKTTSGYKTVLLPFNELLVTSIGFGLTEKL